MIGRPRVRPAPAARRVRALAATLVAVLALAPPPAHAVVALDEVGRTIELGAPPDALAFVREDTFLAVATSDGATRIVLHEPSERTERTLDFAATDVALDPSGGTLYAIGGRAGRLALAALDLRARGDRTSGGGASGGEASGDGARGDGARDVGLSVAALDLKARLLEPVLGLGADGHAVIADGASGALAVVSGVRPAGGFAPEVERRLFYDALGGIGGVAVSGAAEFIVVSERARPLVAALNGLGAVGDRLDPTRTDTLARPRVPSVIGNAGVAQGRADGGPDAVLVADYTSETLSVARLDRNLETLTVVATGRINVPIVPDSTIERDPLTGRGRTPVLLAVNPDQSAIVVGNRFSRSIMLFALDGRVLERRGAITLDRPPAALAVSPSGRRVLVAYPDSDAVTLLDLGGDEVPVPRLAAVPSPPITTTRPATAFPALERSGDAAVRDLQRALGTLGYPVGSVDGYVGPATVRALRAAEIDAGIELDAADPATAVETLMRGFGREIAPRAIAPREIGREAVPRADGVR